MVTHVPERLAQLPHAFIENVVTRAGYGAPPVKKVAVAERPTYRPTATVSVRELIMESTGRTHASLFRHRGGGSHQPGFYRAAIRSSGRSDLDTDGHAAAELAEALFEHTLKTEPDLKGLLGIIQKGMALGDVRSLQCVFHSKPMDEILDQKQRYTRVDDVFNEIYRRQDALLSCLSLPQKVWMLAKVRGIINQFKTRKELLNGLATVYGDRRGVSPGVAATDLISYFFRPDKLDGHARTALDLYVTKLKSHVEQRTPARWFKFF